MALRVDPDFAASLWESDADVELPTDWLERCAFDSVACALTAPISVHDGTNLCHYQGFIACGMRTREMPGQGRVNDAERRFVPTWTTYHPFRGENATPCQGARFLWIFTADGDPHLRAQSVTIMTRGLDDGAKHETIADFVVLMKAMAEEEGRPWGAEYDILVPLGLQLLLYLTAEEPDLDWPPPASIARPQQMAAARVGHVGWRVGGAIRSWRNAPPAAAPVRAGVAGGWRLPPHIRKAHWTRVRIATRDEHGRVVGDRLGEQGADWSYELRWIPPTPVNAAAGVPPTVRAVGTPSPASTEA